MNPVGAGARRLGAVLAAVTHDWRARGLAPSTLLIFVGNPRSGTTLVRSLLNAHPAISIAQEWSMIERFQAGERSWRRQLGGMAASAARFDALPQWEGYDYRVAGAGNRADSLIEVIGDKKAGRSLLLLSRSPGLLQQVLDWCPVPVRFIHCVRHPLDVITTKTRRNGLPLDRNVALYFDLEEAAADLAGQVGPSAFRSVYLERVIATPREEMAALCAFLGVEASAAHLDACAERVFDSPRQTRTQLDWPSELRLEAERRAAGIPHLKAFVPATWND